MPAYVPGAPNWMPGVSMGGAGSFFNPTGGSMGAYWPQALMGLGAGMAQAGAPSRQPGGWGKAIGLGLLGAQNMMQQERGRRILESQNERAQAAENRAQTQFDQQQQQYQRQQQFMQNMSGMQGPPGQFGAFAWAFPEQAGDVAGKIMLNQAIPPQPKTPPLNQQDAQILAKAPIAIREGRWDQLSPYEQERYTHLRMKEGRAQTLLDQQSGQMVQMTPNIEHLPAPPGLPSTQPVMGPSPLPPPASVMGAAPRPAGNGLAPPTQVPTVQQTPTGTMTTYPGTRMRQDERKEFRAASNVLSELRQSYEAYRNSLATEGSAIMPGEARDKQQSQYRDLQLKMKEAYNLGVLNGPDLALMEQVINPPGTVGREFRELFGGGGTAGGLIPQLDASVESLLEGKERMIEETYGRPPIGRGGVNIGNRSFSEDDIQDTMRIRGMSRSQVIQALEERYGGSAGRP